MRYIIFLLLSVVLLTSCEKEVLTPQDNNQVIVVPPNNDTTSVLLDIVGDTWVITQYRVGQFGEIFPLNDTLTFDTNTNYHYNSFSSTYSLYPTGSVYNLTINYTPFGNLSGNINDYNIINGIVNGNKFVDISTGSSNNTEYYFWMVKI